MMRNAATTIVLRMSHAMIACCLMLACARAAAQPSGGPYGPMQHTYAVPSNARSVIYVAVDGKAGHTGATISAPTTIEAAIERAATGDAIILRGGTYRTGNLVLNQGVTIQPYANEAPVFKGSEVAAQWDSLGNGLWSTKWTRLFPSKPDTWWRRNREGKFTPPYRFNNDMVFVDGKFLQAVGWEGDVTESTYCIDYDAGVVYIGTDPKNKLVEITSHNAAIIRTTKDVHGKASDKQGYTLRGITFTQYAYRALEIEGTEPEKREDESMHGKEVTGTTIEDCTISFCSRVAGYFRGDHFTMRRCRISDTSTEGVYVIGSADVLLEKNIFMRNNIENITGYYPSAVKIFNQSNRVTCNDNLVTDLPNSNGIWYDVGNADGVFTNNWIENVGHVEPVMPTTQLWPSQNGFFFEISNGAVCAGNVFVNCDHGIMILNSANVQVYNNTLVNSLVCVGRTGRVPSNDHFGWHSSTAPDVDKRHGHIVMNNLFAGDNAFTRSLLFVWQPADICRNITTQQLAQLDYNVFVRRNNAPAYPLIFWGPAQTPTCQTSFATLDDMKKEFPVFSAHGALFAGYAGPMFKGEEVSDYHLLPEFAGANAGSKVPTAVAAKLGLTKYDGHTIGAYPVQH